MNDAARLLELSPDASPEELEARFNELRARLEDKIAKAPTPGLKAKYRESLDEITTAFETLVIAADSTLLPVLLQEVPAATSPKASPGHTDPSPRAKPQDKPSVAAAQEGDAVATAPVRRQPRKSNLEFVLVAVLAVAVLAGGGWWVIKARAEHAEQARLEAEAARVAETKRKAEEAEKVRLAEAMRKAEEAEKSERVRKDKLATQLRTRLAELRIEWEIIEKEPRTAERALNETKSTLRSEKSNAALIARLTAESETQTRYVAWLENYLERHPARLARVRAEELLSARELDAAAAAVDELAAAIAATAPQIRRQRETLLSLDGSLRVTSTPAGLAWELTDSFGRQKSGKAPATVNGVSPGSASVVFKRPGFKSVTASGTVKTGQTASVEGMIVSQEVIFRAESDIQFYVGGTLLGRGTAQLRDATPQTYTVELRRNNYPPYRTNFEVKQAAGSVTYSYNFNELAAENLTCSNCSGRGNLTRTKQCSSCNGRGTHTCNNCDGRGFFNPPTIDPKISAMRITCRVCGGNGRVACSDCNRGRVQSQDACTRCGGDGRVSKLQQSQ